MLLQQLWHVSDKLWQNLPEHSGEDVGKDGDNDEKHEGEDDEGGETAADILPTWKYIFVILTLNSELQNMQLNCFT